MNTHLAAAAAFALVLCLAACSDGPDRSLAATPESSTETVASSNPAEPTEEINPCSPEAPAEETALEGDPAAPGAPILDVVAVDYEFENVPPALPPGPRGFRLLGEGAEFHELALVRYADGETRSLDTLLALPEAEQETALTYVGSITACPGETSPEALGADLAPGRYGLVCFVPVGTTPELRGADLLAAYENPPHHSEGMAVTFEVR